MLHYLARRVFYALPIALSVSLVCFMLVHIAPGDPIDAIVSSDAPKEVVEQIRHDYGLDKPLPVQFALWLGHIGRGDLGQSLATGRPVASELVSAIRNTFALAVGASLIGFLLGCGLGALAATRQGTWVDKLCTSVAVAGVSVPHYWLGMVLVVIFSVKLGVLPAMGGGDGASLWDGDYIRHMILPAATLAVIPMGIITRMVRGLILEILPQDFIVTLRSKGLRRAGIFQHVLKNAAPTAMAVAGLQFGYLVAGSILVETVFSWPGTGLLLYSAIFQRDLPLLQGTILVLALFFVALNLLVDVAQTALDPRIRRV